MPEKEPSSPLAVSDVNTSKDVPWFMPSIPPRLKSGAFTDLLEKYSHIPHDEQEKHLYAVRDQAWDVFPMPCIGLWWWLVLGLSTHPHYPTLLNRLKSLPTSSPPKFLDLGTCLGQDLRKLIRDGVPSHYLYGSDLFPSYEAVGHALFRDSETFKDCFIAADIFDESPSSPLTQTQGTWDVISIFMFLHAFDRKHQIVACRRILDLLKQEKGSIIIGAQSASVTAGEEHLKAPFLKEGVEKVVFQHSKETFRELWEEVAVLEGVEVRIQVEYRPRFELGEEEEVQGDSEGQKFWKAKNASDQRRMFFLVERV